MNAVGINMILHIQVFVILVQFDEFNKINLIWPTIEHKTLA